jgi:hypothetical protein
VVPFAMKCSRLLLLTASAAAWSPAARSSIAPSPVDQTASVDLAFAAQCLGLPRETHGLVYPPDAEAHFKDVHRAMGAWLQKVSR